MYEKATMTTHGGPVRDSAGTSPAVTVLILTAKT